MQLLRGRLEEACAARDAAAQRAEQVGRVVCTDVARHCCNCFAQGCKPLRLCAGPHRRKEGPMAGTSQTYRLAVT